MDKFRNYLYQIWNLIGKNYEKDNLANRLLTQNQKEQDLIFVADQRNNRVGKFFTKNTLYFKKKNWNLINVAIVLLNFENIQSGSSWRTDTF